MLMGPYATLLFGELGARVIKVEPPDGDISRRIDDQYSPGLGPIYLNTNRGKESIALNLREPRDFEAFLRLVAAADVVAHNRPPGSEKRLGLDYESLAAGAVCAALYERERSGVGQSIEVPMFETMVQFLICGQRVCPRCTSTRSRGSSTIRTCGRPASSNRS